MTNEIDHFLPHLLKDAPLNERMQQQLLKLFKQIQKKAEKDRNAEEWFILGYTSELRNDDSHAVEYYGKAIEENQEFEAAYKNRGAVFIRLKEFDDALFDLEKALDLDPKFLEANYQLAVLYAEQDENKKALDQLDKILEKNPEYVKALAQKGSILDRDKQYDKARAILDKAIGLAPRNANLYSQRAITRLFTGDAPGAEEDFLQAQQLGGANYVSLFNMGLATGLQPGKSKQAYQYFEKAFRKQNDLLIDYFRSAKPSETKRLEDKLREVIKNLNKAGDDDRGRFYRDELKDLLERKLGEAGGNSLKSQA